MVNDGKDCKIIGYWMSEKKSQKLNWSEFGKVCRSWGFELVKLDLNRSLEDQGPFSVIIHKLNDILAKALQNDQEAMKMVANVEDYLACHPNTVILDPVENVRCLLDREQSYSIIQNSDLDSIGMFTPPFIRLTSSNMQNNLATLKAAGITFPFVCKPVVNSGSLSHKMSLVFNDAGVADCVAPCVAHALVNHNAVLHKVFIVGPEYHVVMRPSLKNFYADPHQVTIHFDSHDVSKPDSASVLSVLDPEELHCSSSITDGGLDREKLDAMVEIIRRELGLSLLGVDVVVDRDSARHAIIDINPYPGYDGYPEFFESLMRLILQSVSDASSCSPSQRLSAHTSCDDSGFETADSSDEKKKNHT